MTDWNINFIQNIILASFTMPIVLTLTIVKRLEIKGASKYNVKNVHLLLDEQHCI